jgi:UDP-glucose 4-epimerase
MVYIKDFTKVVVNSVKSDRAGGFYNIGSPHRVSLDEMVHGIVEVFSPKGKRSKISYDSTKPNTLQSILDWSKTKNELGYNPEYDYLTMLKDFKQEMDNEPYAKLWGKREVYEKLYKDYK